MDFSVQMPNNVKQNQASNCYPMVHSEHFPNATVIGSEVPLSFSITEQGVCNPISISKYFKS